MKLPTLKSATAIRLWPGYLVLGTWLAFTVVLFGWAVLASLSSTREIFTNTLLKGGAQLSNYLNLFTLAGVGRYFFNSLLYTVLACAGTLIIAAPAAYVLGRLEFRGKKLFNLMFLSALSLPALLITIPLFAAFIQLKMTGSVLTLVWVYIGTSVPFAVFFLTGFFASVPVVLEEAAAMDGCGTVRTFLLIITPVVKPGLITLTIFNFMNVWNDYFFGLVFANDNSTMTLNVALQNIIYGYSNQGNYSGIFAACMVIFFPSFVVYLFLSKSLTSGLTTGAIKG